MKRHRGRRKGGAIQRHQQQHPQQSSTVHRQTVQAVISRSGPLPTAQELAAYGDISPVVVEEIIGMAKREQQHRHDCDVRSQGLASAALDHQNSRAKMGQQYAFGIAIVGLMAAAAIAITGHPATGAIIGTVDLVGLVSAFLVGVVRSKKEGGNAELPAHEDE